MNSNNYKQYDTRWAKLPYRDLPDNIGNNGCGEVAVCNSIIEMTAQMNQTPKTMQPYCRQYACSDGTYWSGIPAMLKHYGCTEVMEHQNMASLWKELAKGNRVAIYMMNNRPAGYKQIHWTSGGHFICSVAYKHENGEHCVYVKDSNSKESYRNGWMSYESSLRGDVSACWSGKLNGSPAPKPTPTKKTKVIDVSAFQDSINWKKAKADGVQGAIIKCGFRHGEGGELDTDKMFLNHIKGANAVGLPVGIYFFTEAINAKEGKEEAQYAIKLWQKAGIPIWYPIGIDSEDVFWTNPDGSRGKGRANHDILSKAKRTEAIKAFAEECKRQGYKSMLYASTSWLNNHVDMSKLSSVIDVWCAQWGSSCTYKGNYIMWQYTSEGRVNGISGNVDVNECYITPKKVNPPAPKPEGKAYPGNYPRVGRAGILIKEAARLAWPSGTPSSKYKWNGGSATAAFTKALDKVYPEHNSWGPAPAKGCSCDVFVGTVVRSSGIDPKFPRGLDEQETYTPAGMFKYVLGGADMYKQSQIGDIIWYDYSGPGGHVLIRGKDCLYQAGYQSTYGHVTDGLDEIKDTEPKVVIFRPRNYLMKGDTGIDVTRLQKYVNWYFDGAFFKECGEADGIYGNNTLKWVKKMQRKLGFPASECNGEVGLKTTAAMKTVRK